MFGFCKHCNTFHCDEPEFDQSRVSSRDRLEGRVTERLVRPKLSTAACNAVRGGWPEDMAAPYGDMIDELVVLRESMGDAYFHEWLNNLKNCGAVLRGEILARMKAVDPSEARARAAAERAEEERRQAEAERQWAEEMDEEAERRREIESICQANGLPSPSDNGFRANVLQRVSSKTLGVHLASHVLGVSISRVKWLTRKR